MVGQRIDEDANLCRQAAIVRLERMNIDAVGALIGQHADQRARCSRIARFESCSQPTPATPSSMIFATADPGVTVPGSVASSPSAPDVVRRRHAMWRSACAMSLCSSRASTVSGVPGSAGARGTPRQNYKRPGGAREAEACPRRSDGLAHRAADGGLPLAGVVEIADHMPPELQAGIRQPK